MAVKFTQREWFIGQETTEHGLCIEELISDRWVVVAYVPDDYRYHDRAVANARLIAAAPELLEALQGVLWMAEEWFKHGGDETTFSDDYKESLDEARAVILKATGEA